MELFNLDNLELHIWLLKEIIKHSYLAFIFFNPVILRGVKMGRLLSEIKHFVLLFDLIDFYGGKQVQL